MVHLPRCPMTGLWSRAKQERMKRWGKVTFSLGVNYTVYLQLHRGTGQQSLVPKAGLSVTMTAQGSE